MKKYVDGQYIEMTEEEIANLPKEDVIVIEPTILERIEAIESAILEGVLFDG